MATMKLTEKQLRKIVKEEVRAVGGNTGPARFGSNHERAATNKLLHQLHEAVEAALDVDENGGDLEELVSGIAIIEDMLRAVQSSLPEDYR